MDCSIKSFVVDGTGSIKSSISLNAENKIKTYDLYFSTINYKEIYFPGNLIQDRCELHGDELKEGEIIEIKWSEFNIIQHEVKLLIQQIGLSNKRFVPYIITKYGDYNVEILIAGLSARRLYEPKK